MLGQRLQDKVEREHDQPGDTDPAMRARSIETLLILRSVMQPMHQEMARVGVTHGTSRRRSRPDLKRRRVVQVLAGKLTKPHLATSMGLRIYKQKQQDRGVTARKNIGIVCLYLTKIAPKITQYWHKILGSDSYSARHTFALS